MIDKPGAEYSCESCAAPRVRGRPCEYCGRGRMSRREAGLVVRAAGSRPLSVFGTAKQSAETLTLYGAAVRLWGASF